MNSLTRALKKKAYLTFDDGPSDNTVKILQLLDYYQIKATFFVIGNVSERHRSLYREIITRGHQIGLHSFTHQYSYIYASLENFKADLDALEAVLNMHIGFVPSLYRFPGGSNNNKNLLFGGPDMGRLKEEIKRRGLTYYDWDVDSGDTSAYLVEPNVIIHNVLTGSRNQNRAIILLHDAPVKTTTVEALPGIMNGLMRQGFSFNTLKP